MALDFDSLIRARLLTRFETSVHRGLLTACQDEGSRSAGGESLLAATEWASIGLPNFP